MIHFAIVLVELDLRKEKEHMILYERLGHYASVSIGYEQHPTFCSRCEALGHDTLDCSRGGPSKQPKAKQPNINPNGPSMVNSSPRAEATDPGPSKTNSGPTTNISYTNKGKAPAQTEWVQNGLPNHLIPAQQVHTPAITNALVIYTALAITTTNSFAALNCNIPDGLDHEDDQEDLLARAAADIQPIITSPRDSIDSLRNNQE